MAEVPMWGRPTLYKGIRMRSRLEATWAAHFDAVGTPWEYEPLAFANEDGQYLPDFRVHGYPSLFSCEYYEIKPPLSVREIPLWQMRMEIIWSSEPDAGLFLMTGPPEDECGWIGINIPGTNVLWDFLGVVAEAEGLVDPSDEEFATGLLQHPPFTVGAVLRSRKR